MIRRILAAVLVSGLLAACGTLAPTPPAVVPLTRGGLDRFELQARILLRQDERADILRLVWQHDTQVDQLEFAGPLGQTLAQLRRDADGALWTDTDGRQLRAADAATLLARLTRVPVSLDALAAWLTGTTTEVGEVLERDAQGRLRLAREAGWRLRVVEYESDAADALPRQIEASYGESVFLRVAIEAWTL